jgi:hypothetical protein
VYRPATRLVIVGLLAVVLGQVNGATAADPPLGTGASQVWILRPAGPIRSVVVFLHGWGTFSPEGTPWIDHLRARGNAVVFPAISATKTIAPQRGSTASATGCGARSRKRDCARSLSWR